MAYLIKKIIVMEELLPHCLILIQLQVILLYFILEINNIFLDIDVTSGAMSILGTNSSSVVKRTNRKGIVSSAGNIVTTSTLMVSTSGNIHHQQQQANICGSNTVTAPLSNTISAHSSVNGNNILFY